MDNKYKKNISFICLIMIVIHLGGLLYQIITKASLFAICIKLLFISMLALLLLSAFKFTKIAPLIAFISSGIIIIVSAIYMDFLSIIVAIITILYSLKLKKNN